MTMLWPDQLMASMNGLMYSFAVMEVWNLGCKDVGGSRSYVANSTFMF